MWKKMVISAAIAAATAASPAAAATTLNVSTQNAAGWAVITPGSVTPVNAVSTVRNPAWADVPWISTVPNGGTNIAPGTYSYVFSLTTPRLFNVISGIVYADNRIDRIFVNGIRTNAFVFSPSAGSNFATGAGRTFNFDISGFGVINSITFETTNFPLTTGGREPNPGSVSVGATMTAVPEPGTWMLMILGLGAVGFAMRRRHSTSVNLQFA